LAQRDVQLAQEAAEELYARGRGEHARAIEVILARALDSEAPEAGLRSEFLTSGRAARALGVSPQTIKNWVAAGNLRGVRLGGRLLVPRAAIQAYLDQLREAQRQAPRPTRERAAAALRQHERAIAGLPAEAVARYEELNEKLQDGRRMSRHEREEMAALARELATLSTQRMAERIAPRPDTPAS
jgi:excisionase family DNA binding protein